MKKLTLAIFTIFTALIFSSLINAQGFYQMGSGSYMTGYGRVNGSFGYAMATQQMYQTVQMNLQRSMARAAMVKKWGEAAVRKAEQDAARNGSSSTRTKPAPANSDRLAVPPPAPAPKYYGRFRPDSSVDMAKTISDTLVEEPEERELLKKTIEAVQGVYIEEATAKGWQNNIASGMTFFLISMTTVYHDSPEPGDELTNAIYDAVNQSIDAVPDFAKASDKDKHSLNDMLVGFTALPLGVYIEGKQNGNQETVKLAKIWAGEMIKLVLKTDPENVRFDNGTLTIKK